MKTIVTDHNNAILLSNMNAGDVCKVGTSIYLVTKEFTLVNVVTGDVLSAISRDTSVHPALSAELNVTF